MPLEESKHWRKGNRQASYYADDLKRAKEEKERDAAYPKAVKPEEMPWEDSPHGRLKHLAREGINSRIKDIDMTRKLPPGGSSGKHRHTAEELMFISKGGATRSTGMSTLISMRRTSGTPPRSPNGSIGRKEIWFIFR